MHVRVGFEKTFFCDLTLQHYVLRLLGKLLVNLLQVVTRTNTPTNSLTNGVVGRPWVLGSWVRIPPSTIMSFLDFPRVELEKHSARYPQEMIPPGY